MEATEINRPKTSNGIFIKHHASRGWEQLWDEHETAKEFGCYSPNIKDYKGLTVEKICSRLLERNLPYSLQLVAIIRKERKAGNLKIRIASFLPH